MPRTTACLGSGLDVAVVELDERLRGDRLGGDEIPAGLCRAHPGHPWHGHAVGEAVVVEEQPLARLREHLVFLEIGWGEELEVVEVLVRQERHPVSATGLWDRGQRRRQGEDGRQLGDESGNTLDTGVCSHRYVSWGAGAVVPQLRIAPLVSVVPGIRVDETWQTLTDRGEEAIPEEERLAAGATSGILKAPPCAAPDCGRFPRIPDIFREKSDADLP